MKTQNSKPKGSSFRKGLPYLAGLPLIALALWTLAHQQETPESSAELSHPAVDSTQLKDFGSNPEDSVSIGKTKRHRDCSCPDCESHGLTLIQQVGQVPVATQPDVEALLKRFRKGDKKVEVSALAPLKNAKVGKAVAFQAGGIEWKGILDSRLEQGGVFHAGVTLDDGLGRFVVSVRPDQKILATVFFTGENQVLTAKGLPENGSWTMETSVYEKVACKPAGTVYTPPPPVAKAALGAPAVSSIPSRQEFANGITVPSLNSKPDSKFVLYIDFDGEVVTHPAWAGGQTIDAQPLDEARSQSFIQEVWRRASEDYAPFDINVTTDRIVYDAADPTQRTMGIATTNNAAAPGAGGVAMLSSFGQEIPFWIFNNTPYSCADTVSHEGGHVMGLMHDGTTAGVEYYGGQGSGAVSWAPIMGAAWADEGTRYIEEVSSWSRGEYPNANNKEDDLRIITSNGFGYRTDDVPNSRLAAKTIGIADGSFSDGGIIERNDDTDWFKFSTRGGALRLQIKALDVRGADSQRGANLGISATLYNGQGKELQISNLKNSLDSSFSLTVAPGDYYVKVEGAAKGTTATSFTKYASLGQYFISGTVPLIEPISISPTSAKFPARGGLGSFNVSSALTWTWSCEDSWVESVELKTQSGNQYFEYVVKENTGFASRTAMIVLTSGNYKYSHSVIQEARLPDDHGNTRDTSTLVEVQSQTDGRINYDGDVDLFRIDVQESGILTVGTTGLSNTYGRLLDQNGIPLASNDDGDKVNFELVHPVAAGVYYVEVSLTGAYNPAGGTYQLKSSFTPSAAITIDPVSRVADYPAASFGFDLTSSSDWTWSVWSYDGAAWIPGCTWLTTAELANQSQSQRFSYNLDENTSGVSRMAQIRLRRVGSPLDDVVHQITQVPPGTDDHGNNIASATPIALTGSVDGVIHAEGDVDVFKVVLTSIGELTIGTTGSFDTFGALLDADGNTLASNDDLSDLNFGITRSLMPGTYFIQVRHYLSTEIGSYRLFTSFKSPSLVRLSYRVDRTLGSISGSTSQTIKPGGNGRQVKASAKPGYVFTGWSDGVLTAARTDMRVLSDLTVTALFSRVMTVEKVGGGPLVDNDPVPVDFGSVSPGQPSVVSFVVKNIGTKALQKINVTRYGSNASDWTISPLPQTTLNPNESVVITATFLSTNIGTKFGSLTINADGNPLPFRIQVTGTVGGVITGKQQADAGLVGNNGLTSPSEPGATSVESGLPKGAKNGQAAVWADTNPDGTVQHVFSQPQGQSGIPDFWISLDGLTWVRSTVLAVWELNSTGESREVEVLLSTMGLPAERVKVSNGIPSESSP